MSSPALSEALHPHFDGAPSVYASAVDDAARPLVTRVLGAWPTGEADRVRFCVSAPYSADFLAAAAPGRRIAIVVVQVATYLTYQFKGTVVSQAPAGPAAAAETAERIARFAALVAHVGIDPVRYPQTYTDGPLIELEMTVEAVFDQTPRVGAGALVRASEVRA